MKESYGEGIASHTDFEPCVGGRKDAGEALTGETTGQPLSREIRKSGMPTLYRQAEGKTTRTDTREVCGDPARSKTLSMSGSLSHRNWEISTVAGGTLPDGAEKGNRNAATDTAEKSDTFVVPKKPPNNGRSPAEVYELVSAQARALVGPLYDPRDVRDDKRRMIAESDYPQVRD